MATGRGRLGGGNGDKEMGRGAMVRGNGEGERGGCNREGEKGQEEGISQMDMMECLGGHTL